MYFNFNNNVYKQIISTPVGSSITPFYVDIETLNNDLIASS